MILSTNRYNSEQRNTSLITFFSDFAVLTKLLQRNLLLIEKAIDCLIICNNHVTMDIFQIYPLLVQSLSCDDLELQLVTMETLRDLIYSAPDVIEKQLDSFIPQLLRLSTFKPSMVRLHLKIIRSMEIKEKIRKKKEPVVTISNIITT